MMSPLGKVFANALPRTDRLRVLHFQGRIFSDTLPWDIICCYIPQGQCQLMSSLGILTAMFSREQYLLIRSSGIVLTDTLPRDQYLLMHFLGRIFDDALPRNIRIELAFLHSCSFLCQKVLPVWNLLMCMFLRTSIVLCVQNTNFRLQVKYGKLNSIGQRAIRNCPVLKFGLPPREAGYSNVLGHHLLL